MSIRHCGFVVIAGVLAVAGCKDSKEAKSGEPSDKAKSGAKVDDKAAPAPEAKPAVAAAPAIAMAVLVEGHTIWLGNDSFEQDDNAKFTGFHGAVGQALTTLAAAGPAGSTAALITYGTGANVRRPFGDARTLSTADLGTQQDHDKVPQRDLLAGLKTATTELAARPEPRKVLVVIGDGLDTKLDADFTPAIDALKAAGIETYTILAISDTLEGSSANMTALGTAGAATVAAGDLATSAKQIVDKINAPK